MYWLEKAEAANYDKLAKKALKEMKKQLAMESQLTGNGGGGGNSGAKNPSGNQASTMSLANPRESPGTAKLPWCVESFRCDVSAYLQVS